MINVLKKEFKFREGYPLFPLEYKEESRHTRMPKEFFILNGRNTLDHWIINAVSETKVRMVAFVPDIHDAKEIVRLLNEENKKNG